MNIAFIACFYNTPYFKLVSDGLEKGGHNVFWISPSLKWKDWLINNGVKNEEILMLRRDEFIIVDSEFKNLLKRIETYTGITMKTVYYMDRVVSKWNWLEAEPYLHSVFYKLNNFIQEKEIEVVFGEATAANEIACALLCQFLNKKFYHPLTVRIPSDRFAFFKGYLNSEFEQVCDSETDKYLDEAKKLYEKVKFKNMKPGYWYSCTIIPKINTRYFKTISQKVVEAVVEAKSDATVKSLKYQLLYEKKYMKPFRYLQARKIFEKPKAEEKFVLYTLHKQPEASIDVFGHMFANQLELIKNISKVIPSDICLYVKEHPNCLGDRSISYLNEIKKIPGVRLIDPFLDSHELIKKSEMVVTVSGTIAFETGLHGKKAITFSEMFFNKLSTVFFIDNVNDIPLLLQKKIEQDLENDIQVLAYILANSFQGLISDPLTTPMATDYDNINKLINGFAKVLEKV